MKKYIKIIFTGALIISMQSGCKKFLDVAPDSIGTIDYVFRMRTESEKYLFTCYNNLPFLANIHNDPGFIGGDEFALPYPNSATFNAGLYNIARGEQSIVSPIANFWDGASGGKPYFQALRECNIFLENIDKVPDLSDFERKRWVAEVKFLKAYYHYFLLRMYGPIPIIRTSLPIGASIEDVRISRMPVDSVTNYISGLLDEAAADLPPQIMNEASELGRVTKTIALGIKAEMLVMAASPLFNGNPDYANFKDKEGVLLFSASHSDEKWVQAAEACKAAIEAAHASGAVLKNYIIEPGERMSDSTRITMSIRTALTEKWNPEVLWGATNSMAGYTVQALSQARITSGDPGNIPTPPSTNESIHSMLAPPIHIAEMFYSANGVPIDEDKTYDYANRFTRIRKGTEQEQFYIKKDYETVQLNFDREPRFYADLGFDGGIWYGQGLYDDTKTWYLQAKAGQLGARLGASLYSVTGYWPKKLVNYRTDFGGNSGGYNALAYPWPMMRLSDLYLLYAEALNEANGPTGEAYTWIDQVRERAGLDGVVQSWATHSRQPNKPTTKEGFRDIIRRERLIELVFESKRFWDLRRWKLSEFYMNTPIQGWDIEQKTAQTYYRVKQLYTPVFTTRDYLWPLSERAVINNPKLVQNPLW